MAGKVFATQSSASFEYELLEDDPDHLRTVVATPTQITPWIEPSTLKLRHRIGRGPFGDVWLATHHQSAEDYDGSHEVAIKMLHPLREDNMKTILDKFDDLFSRCQGLEGLCYLHGISVISGKICIVMKFYEGSIWDKMSRLKGGKLSLTDALRYGIDLAEGILELHSKGILVLNLKPSNFLLTVNDKAIIGDVGIPYLLLGIQLPATDVAGKLGTPNNMAPEQWQPEVRGPISFETDSWGFGCSILEMLTGIQPWSGKSVEEIHHSVVVKQEKPRIIFSLPPILEKIIVGCFIYDFRSRPLMSDILRELRSLQVAISDDGAWAAPESTPLLAKSSNSGYTEWFLMKDRLQVGDMVRSRKPLNSCRPENMDVPEGTIVGLECDTDRDGFVLVRLHGMHDPVRVHTSALERVTFGLAAGEWVRVKEEDRMHSPVGVLHSVDRDGSVCVGFIGLETLWRGRSSDLQMAESIRAGQFVKLKTNVLSPKFEWPRKRGVWATGRVKQVLPNGCLVIKFPGIVSFGDNFKSFLADPAEVEVVSFSSCPSVLKKYEHLEDFHWAVRPLLVALGLFTAMKVGLFVGTKIRGSKIMKSKVFGGQGNGPPVDGHSATNPAWFRPSVANILFKEGVITTTAR